MINRYGLRPAKAVATGEVAPLTAFRDLDQLTLLNGVNTFNFHPHLPHYELTTEDPKAAVLLARQPIDRERPHPFVQAGNDEFNAFIWMPPTSDRPGDIVLADSTIFTVLFGESQSIRNFWRNLVTMR